MAIVAASQPQRGIFQTLRELIGGTVRRLKIRWYNQWTTQPTLDPGTADYAYYDRARRGQQPGLEVAGLLLKPVESKIAGWTLGKRPSIKLKNKRAAERFMLWLRQWHPVILRAYRDSISLGDSYLVVNGDLSLSVVSPETVDPLVDDADFSKVIGWRITQVHQHPQRIEERQTIIDEYTAARRVRTILSNGTTVSRRIFPNPTGRLTVIHIANNQGSDEMFGRPECEALVNMKNSALHKYNDIFEAAAIGNIRQGRPTPTFEKLGSKENVEAFWEKYGRKETYTLADGTTEDAWVLDFDADQAVTLGGDATFNYKSPGAFAKESEVLLGLLFLLFLQHTEIPEFILGAAVNSSHASVDAQLPPFVKFVEARQGLAESWLAELVLIVMGIIGASDQRMRLAMDDVPEIEWEPLTAEDGKITLDTISWAYSEGLLDDETALRLMPVEIENPRAVLAKAREEREARQQASLDQEIRRAEERARQLDQRDAGGNNPPEGDTENEDQAEQDAA